MEERQPLNIMRPPDFVFKYRRPNRVNPAQAIIKEDGTFQFIGVKYPTIYHQSDDFFKVNKLQRDWFKYPVFFRANEKGETEILVNTNHPPLTPEEEKMGGQLACFEGVPYPHKGHPFPEEFVAINVAKRMVKGMLEMYLNKEMWPFIFTFGVLRRKKKLRLIERFLMSISETVDKAMDTYILQFEFMNKYGKEIYLFVSRFLIKYGVREEVAQAFAEKFAAMIDVDNAYWMRLGDTMSETTKEKLLRNPRKELLRLSEFLFERNPTDPKTGARLRRMFQYASYALYLPKVKRIFRQCIQESTFENFQFDDADKYHCLLFGDYDYLGLPVEQRLKMYEAYHTEHPPFPPRMVIRTS